MPKRREDWECEEIERKLGQTVDDDEYFRLMRMKKKLKKKKSNSGKKKMMTLNEIRDDKMRGQNSERVAYIDENEIFGKEKELEDLFAKKGERWIESEEGKKESGWLGNVLADIKSEEIGV